MESQNANDPLDRQAWLKTPLGLFFLSSVLLPLLIWFYGEVTDRYARHRKIMEQNDARSTRIEKIDTEISFRYSKAMKFILSATKSMGSTQDEKKMLSLAIAQMTANPRGEDVQALYPEFEKLGGYALLCELRDNLVSSGFPSERLTLPGTVQNVFLQLSMIEDQIELESVSVSWVSERLKLAMYLPKVEQINPGRVASLSRWNKGFARTDCSINQSCR